MAEYQEESIRNYSGLSSETKPDAAGGVKVPNGSRWREIDTLKSFFYNKADDAWYEFNTTIDASTSATTTITYPHHAAHGGLRYYVKYWLDVDSGDVVDIRVATPNTLNLSHLLYGLSFEGEFNFWFYRTVTKDTAGTALTPINRRHGGAAAGTIVDYIVNTSIANANADTGIGGADEIARGKGGSGKQIGGTLGSRDEDILATNEIYSLRIENDAVGTLWFDWDIDFYEHTDKN